MCGIIGFIKENCLLDVYKGLELLEYRGYDSVGIAFNYCNQTKIIKQKGRVKDIKPKLNGYTSDIAIGHTRWATHGKPTEKNAHPHKCRYFTIVHNGIIENADSLKEGLIKKGYKFLSETDSEVIAVLLQDCFTPDNILLGIHTALSKLVGSYAVAILSEYTPKTIYLAKKDNPLIIGKGKDFYCFASDSPAIVGYTQNLYRMKDNEIALLSNDTIELFDNNLKKKKTVFHKTYLTVDNINKGSYPTYMLKEIFEIPRAVKSTINYLKKLRDIQNTCNFKDYNSIIFLGCGTAYHAGLFAKSLLDGVASIHTQCITSDEFLYSSINLNKKTLIIAISQSGETADTIGAIKKAKKSGAKVIAITNVPYSTITEFSDYCLLTLAGVEIAVGATKSYATQLIVLKYLCGKICGSNKLINELLPQEIQQVLTFNRYIKDFVYKNDFENLFFIGKGVDYQTALEGALKVKEISYVYSDASPAGEIKHGPLAMVGAKTLVVCIITKEIYLKGCLNAVNEVKSRGASVLVISPFEKISANQITIPKSLENDRSVLSVIPLQLLSYYLSIKKGLDPDKPRNLAKSVTVG